MNWYLQSGKESDVAFSSKVELARNVNGYVFELQNPNQIESLENKIKENLFNIGYNLKFLKLKDMDEVSVQSLVEKGLISKSFAENKRDIGSILINEDENICIEINGENHLNIQVFASGLDLKNVIKLAQEIDTKIGENIEYAVSQKYGFLTRGFENIGTGLNATIKLYLPALAKTRNARKLLGIVSSLGVESVVKNGDIYEITNQKTLGVTEQEIISNLHLVAEKIISQEREARKILEENEIELEDRVYRSYGVLSNCRKISSREAYKLLSDVKLGVDIGILKELTDLKIMKLYLYTNPASLQKYTGNQMDKLERNIKRAEVIKEIIKS